LPEFGVDVLPVVGPGREIVEFLDDAGVGRYLFRDDLPDDPKAPRDAMARAALWAGYVRSALRLLRDLEEDARGYRPDLLFASRPFAWVVAGMLGRRIGVPVVWRAGTVFEHWLQPGALRLFSRFWPPAAVVYTST